MINKRASERIALWLEDATLRETGASSAPITVQDLSTTGFRAEWLYRLPVGSRVWLKLGELEALAAIVAWNRNFEIGCRFEHPLHPAVFARIVALHQQAERRSVAPRR